MPCRRAARLGLVLAGALLASACSALPEWADPGAWGAEETPPPSQISAAEDLEEAQSGDFPNLSGVPDEPREATSAAQRKKISKSLAADRSNASYSGQQLVGSGAAAPSDGPAAPGIAKDLGAAASATAGSSAAPTPKAVSQAAPAPQVQAPAAAAPKMRTPAAIVAQATTSQAPQPTPQATPQPTPQATPRQTPIPQLPALPRRSELAAIIYFADGSDSLNADDRAVLRDIVALSRERDARVRIIGHASARTRTVDPIKHRIVNLEISQKRADAVAAALVRLGLKRDRVRVEAQADAQPVYHEFMPTGEAGNRRAEIFLEY